MFQGLSAFLQEIGLNLRDVVAGLVGGAVNALAFGRADMTTVVSSMFVGAAVANYCQELVVKVLGTSPGTSAFVAGVGAMAIVQGIVKAFQAYKYSPTLPPGGGQ